MIVVPMLTLPPDSYEMLVRFFWTTFKGFLTKREKEAALDEATEPWGIKVERVEM